MEEFLIVQFSLMLSPCVSSCLKSVISFYISCTCVVRCFRYELICGRGYFRFIWSAVSSSLNAISHFFIGSEHTAKGRGYQHVTFSGKLSHSFENTKNATYKVAFWFFLQKFSIIVDLGLTGNTIYSPHGVIKRIRQPKSSLYPIFNANSSNTSSLVRFLRANEF